MKLGGPIRVPNAPRSPLSPTREGPGLGQGCGTGARRGLRLLMIRGRGASWPEPGVRGREQSRWAGRKGAGSRRGGGGLGGARASRPRGSRLLPVESVTKGAAAQAATQPLAIFQPRSDAGRGGGERRSRESAARAGPAGRSRP
ncbi:hypothetical protein J1605_021316 [Eschrichtius robustus]|uniref:Uncharacterized protein n=1 Tax=Eschrichtius robustus TaxID=9764 RepID=A0AB34HF26_ESCRO|nr:hypothetical protein J1605_021316 [Eschrichtius robustus]